ARAARDWPAATDLQDTVIVRNRDQAAGALAAEPASLSSVQHNQLRDLAVSLEYSGRILAEHGDRGCLPRFQEALELYQRIGDRPAEANAALGIGNACRGVPGLRDLDQAEHWYSRSLSLTDDDDQLGCARCLGSLGGVALDRFGDARADGQPEQV